MTPLGKTQELKKRIQEALLCLIDDDYVLLDVPNHSNLGDTLIWQGTLDLMNTTPYRCKYCTYTYGNIEIMARSIKPSTIILLQGGGNFGDVWFEPNDFRKKVITKYPNQKTIVLPQTIYYQDEKNLMEDAAFYAKHPNVTICARDERSYQLLKERFPKNPSLLVPDMAFCMDMSKYRRIKKPQGSVFVRREDKEFQKSLKYDIVPGDALVKDWTWLSYSEEYARLSTVSRWGDRLSRFNSLLNTDIRSRLIDKYWYHYLRPLNVRTAIEFIDSYEHIYTTRMHAALLAVILGKTDVTLFDNSYGKSSSLYDTWLRDVDGLRLVK